MTYLAVLTPYRNIRPINGPNCYINIALDSLVCGRAIKIKQQ